MSSFPARKPMYVRGASIRFAATFTDFDGDPTTPTTGSIILNYPLPDGTMTEVTLTLAPPTPPDTRWIVVWDSRGAGVGAVEWFLYSDPGPPFAVQQGQLELCANAANPETFT